MDAFIELANAALPWVNFMLAGVSGTALIWAGYKLRKLGRKAGHMIVAGSLLTVVAAGLLTGVVLGPGLNSPGVLAALRLPFTILYPVLALWGVSEYREWLGVAKQLTAHHECEDGDC